MISGKANAVSAHDRVGTHLGLMYAKQCVFPEFSSENRPEPDPLNRWEFYYIIYVYVYVYVCIYIYIRIYTVIMFPSIPELVRKLVWYAWSDAFPYSRHLCQLLHEIEIVPWKIVGARVCTITSGICTRWYRGEGKTRGLEGRGGLVIHRRRE